MTIRVNLVPSEMWRRQHKFTQIVVIKILLLTYHHLAAILDFTSFFTMAFLGAHTFFTTGWITFYYLQISCQSVAQKHKMAGILPL